MFIMMMLFALRGGFSLLADDITMEIYRSMLLLLLLGYCCFFFGELPNIYIGFSKNTCSMEALCWATKRLRIIPNCV